MWLGYANSGGGLTVMNSCYARDADADGHVGVFIARSHKVKSAETISKMR